MEHLFVLAMLLKVKKIKFIGGMQIWVAVQILTITPHLPNVQIQIVAVQVLKRKRTMGGRKQLYGFVKNVILGTRTAKAKK
jgi:hypothetical protein